MAGLPGRDINPRADLLDHTSPEALAEHARLLDELEQAGRWLSRATQSPDFPDRTTAELVALVFSVAGADGNDYSYGMKFRVLIEPDEDGVFVAQCPVLPGCISQGRTRAEAAANIRDAIQGYLFHQPGGKLLQRGRRVFRKPAVRFRRSQRAIVSRQDAHADFQ